MLILFCSCDNTVTLSKLCLYSDVFVSIGTNEVTRQKSDSIVVVVSEETGKISVAKNGTLIADVKEEADARSRVVNSDNPVF